MKQTKAIFPPLFLLYSTMACFGQTPARTTQSEQRSTENERVSIMNAVQQKPEFVGGQAAMVNWLHKQFKYPVAAQKAGVTGNLIASFTVNEDRTISDIDVLKEYGFGSKEEVVRVIRAMPVWRAGKIAGKPVAMKYTLPIQITPKDE